MIKDMNKRINVQSETVTSDGMGGGTKSWTTSATLWGSIKPKSAREFLRAEGVANEVTHVVTLRYRSDIEPDMRLNYGARNFKILSVVNQDESKHYVDLVVKELV